MSPTLTALSFWLHSLAMTGFVAGEYAAIRRHGFGDPRLRLSMLLHGAPPLSGSEYAQYRARHPVATTVGAAVTLVLPWGEYFPDKLINLGGNRYVIRPSLGLLHRRGPWEFECTTSLSFYQDNDEYFGNSRMERDPLWFLQGHVTRDLARGQWLTLSGGCSYDDEFYLNGESMDYSERTSYVSVPWGMALTRQQGIRVAYLKADTQVVLGSSSDNLLLSWSLAWRPVGRPTILSRPRALPHTTIAEMAALLEQEHGSALPASLVRKGAGEPARVAMRFAGESMAQRAERRREDLRERRARRRHAD